MSPRQGLSSLILDEDSQESISESQTSTGSSKVHTMECDVSGANGDLTIDDLRLLVDLFYLPYENGMRAQEIFLDFYWLRFHYPSHGKAHRSSSSQLEQWRCRASVFHESAKMVNRLVQRLTTIANRSLLYDVYHYVNDMNATISLCSKFLHWMGQSLFGPVRTTGSFLFPDNDQRSCSLFSSNDMGPSSQRGGLAGDFLVRS